MYPRSWGTTYLRARQHVLYGGVARASAFAEGPAAELGLHAYSCALPLDDPGSTGSLPGIGFDTAELQGIEEAFAVMGRFPSIPRVSLPVSAVATPGQDWGGKHEEAAEGYDHAST